MPTHATSCTAGVEKYVGLYGTVPPVWAQTLTTLQVRPLNFDRWFFGLPYNRIASVSY
jgi:hypothetical protein